jgi:hypothetical protein
MVSICGLEGRDAQSPGQLCFAASIVVHNVTVDFVSSKAFRSYYAVWVNFHIAIKIYVQL